MNHQSLNVVIRHTNLGVRGNLYVSQIGGESGYPANYGLYVRLSYSSYYLHVFMEMQGVGSGGALYVQLTTSSTPPQAWKQVQLTT